MAIQTYVVNGKILTPSGNSYVYYENEVRIIVLQQISGMENRWQLIITYDVENNYQRTYLSETSDPTSTYELQIDSGDFSIQPGEKVSGLVSLYQQEESSSSSTDGENQQVSSSSNSNNSSSSSINSSNLFQANQYTFAYLDNDSVYIQQGQPSSSIDINTVKLFVTDNQLRAYNSDGTSSLLFNSRG